MTGFFLKYYFSAKVIFVNNSYVYKGNKRINNALTIYN